MLDNLLKSTLEESEAKTYLALLELGPSTVSEITKKAKITRTLGYHVLEKLSWYNLVDKVPGKKNKIIYTAKHPSNLKQFALNKKNSWERKLTDIEANLPKLVNLYKTAKKPTIKYSEGTQGIMDNCEEVLSSKEDVLSIVDTQYWDIPDFRSWGRWYERERSNRHIHERVLILDNKIARAWLKYYTASPKYTSARWIKDEQLPGIADLGGEINIFENKVIMSLLKKPNQMGIFIENETLTNLLKTLFNLAWTVGKPIDLVKMKKK